MTISSQNRKSGPFLGTGSVSEYPFTFTVFEAADVVVTRTDLADVETVLTLGSGYTVTLNADQNATPGGTVVLPAPLTSGFKLTLTSEIAATQEVDLTNQGGFYPQVVSRALDKLTILTQQLTEKVGRSWKIPISSETATAEELMADLYAAAAGAVAAADRVDLGALDAAVADSEAAQAAAEAARTGSESARSLAQAARDAAVVNAAVYADVAAAQADAGLANGAQYQVVSGDLILRYRKDSGAASTLLLTMANGDFALSARRSLGLASSTPYVAFVAGSITPSIVRSFTPAAATQYDIVAVVRANQCDWVHMLCQSGASLNHDCLFRLSTQTIGRVNTSLVPPVQSPTMRYLGGDRWELKVRVLSTGTGAATLQLRPTLDGNFPFTGDTGRGLFVESYEVRLAGSAANLWSTGLITDASFTKNSLTASLVVTGEASLPVEVGTVSDSAESVDVLMTGRMSGVRLTEGTGAGLNVRLFHSITFQSGDTVTIRARAKRDARFRLNLFASVVNIDATFNLDSKTGTGTGAVIEHLGNDWCECTASATAASGGTTNFQIRVFPDTGGHPMTGTGVSAMFLEDVTVWVNGIQIINARSEDFARSVWTKEAVTLAQGAARYIGIKGNVFAAGDPYEDGRSTLTGLRTTVIGDSISAQLNYTAPLAEQTGITLTNLAVGGASLAAGSSAGSLGIFNQIATIPTDAELVIVQAGVNDFGTDNSPLGAIGDTTTATFFGAIHASVVAIRARAPAAAIVFLTPYSGAAAHPTHRHFRTNSRGHTLAQFQEAVKAGAALAGYPVINVGEDSGIGYHTPGLFYDDLHINATGGVKYATFVAAKLRDLALAGVIA